MDISELILNEKYTPEERKAADELKKQVDNNVTKSGNKMTDSDKFRTSLQAARNVKVGRMIGEYHNKVNSIKKSASRLNISKALHKTGDLASDAKKDYKKTKSLSNKAASYVNHMDSKIDGDKISANDAAKTLKAAYGTSKAGYETTKHESVIMDIEFK